MENLLSALVAIVLVAAISVGLSWAATYLYNTGLAEPFGWVRLTWFQGWCALTLIWMVLQQPRVAT